MPWLSATRETDVSSPSKSSLGTRVFLGFGTERHHETVGWHCGGWGIKKTKLEILESHSTLLWFSLGEGHSNKALEARTGSGLGSHAPPGHELWQNQSLSLSSYWGNILRVHIYIYIRDAIHRSIEKPVSPPRGHLPGTIQLLKILMGPGFTLTINGDNSLVFQMSNLFHLTYFLYWKPMKKGAHIPIFTWHITYLEGVGGFLSSIAIST